MTLNNSKKDYMRSKYVSKCLVAYVLQVKREKAEREALGALPLYQRTIP
jgi:hypothetical protein